MRDLPEYVDLAGSGTPQQASHVFADLDVQPLDAAVKEVKTIHDRARSVESQAAVPRLPRAKKENIEKTGVQPDAVKAVKVRIAATATLLVRPDIYALQFVPMATRLEG